MDRDFLEYLSSLSLFICVYVSLSVCVSLSLGLSICVSFCSLCLPLSIFLFHHFSLYSSTHLFNFLHFFSCGNIYICLGTAMGHKKGMICVHPVSIWQSICTNKVLMSDGTTVMYRRYVTIGLCAYASAPLIAQVIDPILLSRVYYQVSVSHDIRFCVIIFY